ncbi:hypothetical protein GCM10010327_07820 [Streptomyces nitrosporeus]|nr:hypothetical protein GCM10010327_07820 [Streptomyces nitrosporeus]
MRGAAARALPGRAAGARAARPGRRSGSSPPRGGPYGGEDRAPQGKETTVDGTVEVPAGAVDAPVSLMTWL